MKEDEPQKKPPDKKREGSFQKNVLSRGKELYEKLEKKLTALYKESGIDHQLVQRYLDNPSNYEPGEWELAQNYRRAY